MALRNGNQNIFELMYNIIYNNKVIDTADTREHAVYLVGEYYLLYGGNVTMEKQ